MLATGDEEAGEDLLHQATAALSGQLRPDHPDVQRAERGERLECDIEPPPT
jgi:hypothetical protein